MALLVGMFLLLVLNLMAEHWVVAGLLREKETLQGFPESLRGVKLRVFLKPTEEAFWVCSWSGSRTLWLSRGWLAARSDLEFHNQLQALVMDAPEALRLRVWLAALFKKASFESSRQFSGFVFQIIGGAWAILVFSLLRRPFAESRWLDALELFWDRDPMRLLLVNRPREG